MISRTQTEENREEDERGDSRPAENAVYVGAIERGGWLRTIRGFVCGFQRAKNALFKPW